MPAVVVVVSVTLPVVFAPVLSGTQLVVHPGPSPGLQTSGDALSYSFWAVCLTEFS